MVNRNTTTESAKKDKGKQDERKLLDSWHPHIESAMKNLHMKFQSDTKLILTESDLKCWLFYYLQLDNSSNPFAVHTEVTHYAEHFRYVKEKEKKYKFRDMSLLCPDKIKDAEEIWDETTDDFVNSKGFKHKGPAIHFELKMERQSKDANHLAGLRSDIKKIKTYKLNDHNHIRDFVIVCGSRSSLTTAKNFKDIVNEETKEGLCDEMKSRLGFYLFDKTKMVCMKYEEGVLIENTINEKQ